VNHRAPPDDGDVEAVAQELFEVSRNAPAGWTWREVARHVLVQRFAACVLVEKLQLLFAAIGHDPESGDPAYDQVAAVDEAMIRYWKAAPHDRTDCPCGHPAGTTGRCAGCNCADDDPSSELQPEDALEAAFWTFDSRRAGRGRGGVLEGSPMAERDAFKLAVRRMLGEVRRESDLARKHRDADRDEQDLELRAAQSARAALVRRCEAMVSALGAEATRAEEAVAAATISRSERFSEADVLRRFADIMRGIAALKDVEP
jgi:hypothetical protein